MLGNTSVDLAIEPDFRAYDRLTSVYSLAYSSQPTPSDNNNNGNNSRTIPVANA